MERHTGTEILIRMSRDDSSLQARQQLIRCWVQYARRSNLTEGDASLQRQERFLFARSQIGTVPIRATSKLISFFTAGIQLPREQFLVVEGLKVLIRHIPFPVLGIDSDNDTAFVNDTLLEFSKIQKLEFTRCRSYHKNDQAWVEQKNGAVVRRLVCHQRYSGFIAGQTLAHLYHHARLYVNYFQPPFKLREKIREGGKVKRTYYQPATPCARLLAHPEVDNKIKEILLCQQRQLDPVELLHRVRESQAALAALVSHDRATEGPGRKTLDQFLSQLPQLWRSGEVRPTHRAHFDKLRHWRTRKDPFGEVWFDILAWLQRDPDATAKELFGRLQGQYHKIYSTWPAQDIPASRQRMTKNDGEKACLRLHG